MILGEPLSPAHRAAIEPALLRRAALEPSGAHLISDPWFNNLLLFRDAHDWRYVNTGAFEPWPCISGHAYDGTHLLLPLFELEQAPPRAMAMLLHQPSSSALGMPKGNAAALSAFGPLSAAQALRLPAATWAVQHHRDEADYVYTADSFRRYRGTALQKKGNLVRQLLANHDVRSLPYDETSAPLRRQAQAVLAAWMQAKGKAPGDADEAPCRQALREARALGLHGVLYFIGDDAVGFLLAEPIAADVMVMRFAKAIDALNASNEPLNGLYQHMFQDFCQRHASLRWLNFEPDLGLPNFRQTKLSYQPAALLEKFRARPIFA